MKPPAAASPTHLQRGARPSAPAPTPWMSPAAVTRPAHVAAVAGLAWSPCSKPRAWTWPSGAPATRPRVAKGQSGTRATGAAQRTEGCPCTPARDGEPMLLAGHPHVAYPLSGRAATPGRTASLAGPRRGLRPLTRQLYLLPHPPRQVSGRGARVTEVPRGPWGGEAPSPAVRQPNPTTLGWRHRPRPVWLIASRRRVRPQQAGSPLPGPGRLPLRSRRQLTGPLAAAARARAGQSRPRAHGPRASLLPGGQADIPHYAPIPSALRA